MLFISLASFAVCVSTKFTPLAVSGDGLSFLVREEASGPEGGDVRFLLVAGKRARAFEASSVSALERQAGLAAFNRALRKANFRASLPFAGAMLPERAEGAELARDLSLPAGTRAFSRDGKHFVVVTGVGCESKCYRVLRDPTPHILGGCATR